MKLSGNRTRDTLKREVVASRGMVVTNHPMASAAGAELLAMGGNAVDAAVGAAFALTVVEPMMVGIFGAGFVNFYRASAGEVVTIDNYATAPMKATPDMYEPVSDTWPDYMETAGQRNRVGHLAVAVPGSLKSWCHLLERYGRLDLETVLNPAIRYARRGFPASGYLADIIDQQKELLARYPATAEVFLPGGEPPRVGQAIVRDDYARTLEAIARHGSAVLYGGPLGEAVARDMEANGGILTLEDLRAYRIKYRTPVRGSYRGYEVVSMGPPCSGGPLLVHMLNVLEGFDVGALGFGTASYVHLLAETMKLAFADRFRYLGDPDFVDLPLEELLSKDYAARRREQIDLERAREYSPGDPYTPRREPPDTTHLTVADDEGNVVAMTQTIHELFGSRVTVPGTGMLLNNNMYIFDPHPGRPNSIAPGKRMVSSMAPTILFKAGRPVVALGTPGGTRIFPSVLQAILNIVDHRMTLQEAVEAPRVWTQGQELEVEEGIAPEVRRELEGRGHRVVVVPRVAGGMTAVALDHDAGLLVGAACWRADGAPVGIGGGPAKPGIMRSGFRVT